MLKVFATLEYNGDAFTLFDIWPGGDDPENIDSLTFYWEEGNAACDCSRSAMARAAGLSWPELPCNSEQIELTALRWEKEPDADRGPAHLT